LAEEMGVGYFDRPDNSGAKAGNLNHALGLTSSPYIVTFDADMIPQSKFLLKTIPYFVDVELREKERPENERLRLGLLQTSQSFYDPDVFQHALFSEKRASNEQDFFYRTIEPAKTASNSVIYGGSNTVLSRKALEDVGGFYTESITEDFATGLLIESKGYVSLALPEPLASGQTPHTFKEHIKQRTRWARGVIVTARKLKIWRRRELTLTQKFSYWSSVVYWYSPVKNLIYILSPLLYALLAVPVFRCTWAELLVFWLPMFALQDLGLRMNSKNAISTKWSGIYETSVMLHLFIPTVKEFFGVSTLKFKVTDKSKQSVKRQRDVRSMVPFLILTGLSVAGIVRIVCIFSAAQAVGLLILLFWIIRNLYFLIMSLFLIDGRDGDGETVKVIDAEFVTLKTDSFVYEGVTTLMTEHSMSVYLDEGQDLEIGTAAEVTVFDDEVSVTVKGVVVGVKESRNGIARLHTVEILDFDGGENEYLQLLYDRVPTLPQSLHRDFGVLSHLWQNIAHRIARTGK
ncbi:MAG: glycosyltransferase, partial [Clostridia bacterium]|nr:glycosyltransferase [Clostridia bacterium]